MNDFKLRFSDIFKYILLGAVQSILFKYAIDSCVTNNNLAPIDLNFKNLWNIVSNDPIVPLIISLCIFYLMGFLTQMVILLFCKGNFLGSGLGEVGCFVKRWPSNFLNTNKYPHWMYYSNHPDKVLGIYREIMETSNDADITTEYLYANNLFQGLALSIIIFASFSYPSPSIVWNVAATIILGMACCVLGYFSTKRIWALRLNKLSMGGMPLLIFVSYWIVDKWQFGLLTGLGELICLAIAEQLSRRHIRRIDMLIKYADNGKNESAFLKNLERNGLPVAFILTRVSDSSYEYYFDQLTSIKQQTYPNIKALVLIDRNSKKYDSFVDIIEKYRKESGLNISHFISEGTGPACLAHEIRDIFLNYAGQDDVAISLDGDDIFASDHVVARIMGRLGRTKANICLITFEIFGDTKVNYTKAHPNEIVKKIAEQSTDKGIALTSDDLIINFDAHLISSIGWTKCYKADVLRKYQDLWNQESHLMNHMLDCSKYEDFPDIIALLMDGAKVCAVGRTSILFRKHAGSVTTVVSADNYRKHVTYYLKKTLDMSFKCRVSSTRNNSKLQMLWNKYFLGLFKLTAMKKDEPKGKESVDLCLSEDAKNLIHRKYIPYKFIQYLNIVKIKTTGDNPEIQDFSPQDFYDNFLRELSCINKEYIKIFHEGMLEILSDNWKFKSQHHTGYYEKDLPHTLCKSEVTLDDISHAYNLHIESK